MDTDYPRDFEAACDNRSAQVIQIENGRAVWVGALAAGLSGIAVALAIFAFYTASQAAMESRLLLQHVMNIEAKQESDHAQRQ